MQLEIQPIIPIVLMAVICVGLGATLIGARKLTTILRRVLMIVMIFMVNLRMIIPGNSPDVKIESSDVYVLFVIDDTISMIAQDYEGFSDTNQKERLDGVKADCAKITEVLYGAKFGVISFHNSANILTPYTDNAEHVASVVNAMYPLQNIYATGTTMNVVKVLFNSMLSQTYEDKDKKTIVFFISDGEITNGEELESFSELSSYISGGAVLGYGSETGGEMHLKNSYDDEITTIYDYQTNRNALSYIDEDNLTQIAKDLGVTYHNMNEGYDLSAELEELRIKNNITANVTSSADVNGDYTDDFPVYFIFVGVLAMLVIWEIVAQRRMA